MIRLFLVCITVLLGFFSVVFAQPEKIGLSEVVQALERPFRADGLPNQVIRDFEADFLQQARLASLDREQHGQGRVEVRFDRKTPGKGTLTQFRWEYREPSQQEIISDGRTLWVYLPENNQVIQSEIEENGEARVEDPMNFLTGLGNLSRDFEVSWSDPSLESSGDYILRLKPRKGSAVIQEMLVEVNGEAVADFILNNRTGKIFPILSTKVQDPNDNTTRIEFRNVQVNRQLSPDRFSFTLPAGVEVVRPTGQPMAY